MAKVKVSPLFKTYQQHQFYLLPPDLGSLIGPQHLVRVVHEVVERMDITALLNTYKGGGTTSFHPRMLLKVLLYGYCVKLYTGRKIARALEENIHFMWLAGMSRPDFRTINAFRSSRAKEVIELLFKELLTFLMDHNYIRMENYFCDGSTFRADANQHKMVWKKNAQRHKAKVEVKCRQLFADIEEMNKQEDKQYGNNDLEEKGQATTVTKEILDKKIGDINKIIAEPTSKAVRKKAVSIKNKLQKNAGKITRYQTQEAKAGTRSGYNKTDEDASAMMMKNKKEISPAYNVLAGSEDQFITGVTVHQNPNDGTCFKEHLEQIAAQQPLTPQQLIADSVFGSEQNYALLEDKGIKNFVKYQSYHREQKKGFTKNIFLKENFIYNKLINSYLCPNQKELIFNRKITEAHPKTGYLSTSKQYECTDCSGCKFYEQCCKSQKGGNRTIQINEKFEAYKHETRVNLQTDEGKQLKKQRSIEIESCFGDIKHNMEFRRFHLRGLKKVKTDMTLIAMAHNLRKIHCRRITA
ncbi:MAG TPA: IS1182 family transposase [Ferruginibacter sp.]|nr:IS1182 family transposase [Ferruginibacter sp.]